MKKTDWIIIVCLIAYSCLFWQQEPGLNFLIMTCLLLGGQLYNDRTLLKNRVWVIAAMAALITSFSVFWHCNGLSVIGNLVSLLLASSFVINRNNSWFGAFGLAVLNAVTACAFICIEFVKRINQIGGDPDRPKRKLKRAVLVFCILIICGVFFGLYRGSSILFESLTNQIDLSFISIGWCIFMCGGGVLLFGFFNQQNFNPLTDWDRKHEKQLQLQERTGFLDKIMSLDSEYFSGIVMFSILNVMLLLVNGLDIAFLCGGGTFLPDDVTYSEYVHQGINQLILSILFASALIFYWFRSYHSDGKQFRTIRWLAILWVLQNILMIVMTIYRNHGYIFVFGLTGKRIGVDVYLFLAIVGLALVMWKVIKQRSNSFVLHNFGWALFVTLVLSAPVNWDKMIFDYNSGMKRVLDDEYISSLSDYVLPYQYERILKGAEIDDFQEDYVQYEAFRFMTREQYMREHNMWPSMTLDGNATYAKLLGMKDLSLDSSVDVNNSQLQEIYFLPCFANIHTLIAYHNDLKSIGELAQYRKLKYLDIRFNNELASIEGIQKCQLLETLDLRGTAIDDYSPVTKMPNLRVMYVNYIGIEEAEAYKRSNPNLEIKNY